MPIRLAKTDQELGAVQRRLEAAIPGIAPDAVPRTSWGQQNFDVTVAQFLNDQDELVGAALTCRAQVAVSSMMMGDPLGVAPVLDRHSELDLIAVRPEARGQGIGSAMIDFLEQGLDAADVKVWFGNVTTGQDVEQLRSFYSRHGFTVGAPGAPLPPLLGKTWTAPFLAAKPAFYFYKVLGEARRDDGVAPIGVGKRTVTPPDPKKARRPKKTKKKRR